MDHPLRGEAVARTLEGREASSAPSTGERPDLKLDRPAHPPILVTGCHRSGTGWVGDMLGATRSPQLGLIWEPFNPRCRPGISSAPFRHWFTYVCRENARDYAVPLADTLGFHYRPGAELASIGSLKDTGRFLRDWYVTDRRRRRRMLPLMKDPIAVFSAEWLADTFDMDVVVTIRHPAAVVSSIVRLGWHHPFQDFLEQPLMMRDELGDYAEEIRRFATTQRPLVDQAALLWKLAYSVVLQYQERRPSWHFVRHEDLSRDPQTGFSELYRSLGLSWTPEVEMTIREHTRPGNAVEVHDPANHRRDSRRALRAWKRHLSAGELDRIRELTEPVASALYDDESW